MPQGTVRYYDRVRAAVADADKFSRLLHGARHGALQWRAGRGPVRAVGQRGGAGRTEDRHLPGADGLVGEGARAPSAITAAKLNGTAVTRTRSRCVPYPQVARYSGSGSTDDAANFRCVTP